MDFPMPLKIAVIDSGINRNHFHVGNVAGGHGYRITGDGQVELHPDFEDEIGHGTAIAGILSQKAPFADLYAIKIFQKELSASAQVLLVALKWAIEAKMNIIHLSLGTEVEAYREDFNALCQMAHDSGIAILAAARSSRDQIIPAACQTVIGVFWDRNCGKDMITYHPGEKIEFGAYGWPREIPGMPQEMNFRGNSFAVAHVTGMLAQLSEKYPKETQAFLKERLCEAAVMK
ncbi:MAG: S8 family serine peptidase [Pseudomonadota bacterium]